MRVFVKNNQTRTMFTVEQQEEIIQLRKKKAVEYLVKRTQTKKKEILPENESLPATARLKNIDLETFNLIRKLGFNLVLVFLKSIELEKYHVDVMINLSKTFYINYNSFDTLETANILRTTINAVYNECNAFLHVLYKENKDYLFSFLKDYNKFVKGELYLPKLDSNRLKEIKGAIYERGIPAILFMFEFHQLVYFAKKMSTIEFLNVKENYFSDCCELELKDNEYCLKLCDVNFEHKCELNLATLKGRFFEVVESNLTRKEAFINIAKSTYDGESGPFRKVFGRSRTAKKILKLIGEIDNAIALKKLKKALSKEHTLNAFSKAELESYKVKVYELLKFGFETLASGKIRHGSATYKMFKSVVEHSVRFEVRAEQGFERLRESFKNGCGCVKDYSSIFSTTFEAEIAECDEKIGVEKEKLRIKKL